MASQASHRLDRRVLIHKRPARLHMALGANLVLVDRGLQVVSPEGAMHVVAVTALDRAFVHRVVERHIERTLHIGVAGIAERRLRNFEQARFVLNAVDGMATEAAQAGLRVRRAIEIGVRPRMTAKAGGINLLGRRRPEPEDLRYVPTRADMRQTRSMAAFAGDSFAVVHQRETRMRVRGKTLGHVCVAGHAGIGANVTGRWSTGRGSTGRGWLLRCGPLLPVTACSIHPPCFPESGQQRNQRHAKEHTFHSGPPRKRPAQTFILKMCYLLLEHSSPVCKEHKTSLVSLAVMAITGVGDTSQLSKETGEVTSLSRRIP